MEEERDGAEEEGEKHQRENTFWGKAPVKYLPGKFQVKKAEHT